MIRLHLDSLPKSIFLLFITMKIRDLCIKNYFLFHIILIS